MTREEHERLYELINNPPPGSKIAAAREFGIDLTLLLRSLTLTPEQRALAMEDALRFAENLRDPKGKHLMTDFERVLRNLVDAGVNFIIVGAYAVTLMERAN